MAPRLLCILGSGETAPTMTAVHADLLERMGGKAARAVLLDTPYGFQENADDISARARAYFRTNVGHDIEVVSMRDVEVMSALEIEEALESVRRAAYVFAGPGSPSYAIRQWTRTPLSAVLSELLARGGCVVMSSAAATTVGAFALPVYEIYKVGEKPRWLDGIDLLGRSTGVAAAVVPHWDNAEGGTHDTSRCYVGERRLGALECALPAGVGILGVDEHTAAIIDVERRAVEVIGRGSVYWRRAGVEIAVPAGEQVALDELVSGSGTAERRRPQPVASADAAPAPRGRLAARSISEEVAARRSEFDAALAAGDVDSALAALLGLDDGLAAWVHDNPGTDELDRARSDLRGMVVRLGDLGRRGARDPRVVVGPFVDLALELRNAARADRRFADADRIRDALTALGVEVRDTREGVEWVLAEPGDGGELQPTT
jgi:cyanophycinase-like exopeptidase